ncbi:kunitz-type trypsin inhibitor KTI1-like [Bidens hawaiensis]|uniref:kunitz-type trypsin inhibitor KTI1-like n=1 Tax=Bidens hawaiensis TaxID=980011 RepID=UPI004048EB98
MMKSTLLSYAVFIVFIITTQSIPSASQDALYDVNGKKVLNNVPYYLGPVIWAKGGGIKLIDTKYNKKICPSYVVQDPDEVNKGGQFIFTLLAKQKYVLTTYPFGIDSESPTGTCDASTFWKISDPEAKALSNLITTGGSFETALSCFRVVDYPKPTIPKVHSYMLQLCPSVCGAGPRTCFNISLYQDKGVRYLASSGSTPFEFVFQKAK